MPSARQMYDTPVGEGTGLPPKLNNWNSDKPEQNPLEFAKIMLALLKRNGVMYAVYTPMPRYHNMKLLEEIGFKNHLTMKSKYDNTRIAYLSISQYDLRKYIREHEK